MSFASAGFNQSKTSGGSDAYSQTANSHKVATLQLSPNHNLPANKVSYQQESQRKQDGWDDAHGRDAPISSKIA